jgi:hypothetical protein
LRSCHFGDKKFKLLHFSHVWPIGTALARQYVTVRFPVDRVTAMVRVLIVANRPKPVIRDVAD